MAVQQIADRLSWWVGLDREQLQRAIAEREPGWRADKKNFHDFVGGILMRDAWEPRKPRPRREL